MGKGEGWKCWAADMGDYAATDDDGWGRESAIWRGSLNPGVGQSKLPQLRALKVTERSKIPRIHTAIPLPNDADTFVYIATRGQACLCNLSPAFSWEVVVPSPVHQSYVMATAMMSWRRGPPKNTASDVIFGSLHARSRPRIFVVPVYPLRDMFMFSFLPA